MNISKLEKDKNIEGNLSKEVRNLFRWKKLKKKQMMLLSKV